VIFFINTSMRQTLPGNENKGINISIMGGYLLGLDIGSSFVKASVLEASTGSLIASASAPETEMEITSPWPGLAEQHPDEWWNQAVAALNKIRATGIDLAGIEAIGISYQMHGLVVIDRDLKPLRPSIIWCDSRAVAIGEKAFDAIGHDVCLKRLMNSPGNFTASKLAWVKENEPGIYKKIFKFMLPGDYIALKLSGDATTTSSGLSEGILWDYAESAPAGLVLDHFGIDVKLVPDIKPSFGIQCTLSRGAAKETGLKAGIPVAYRAGDQPNNAFSLNVLNPSEMATTAGTSGVVYGVSDRPVYDNGSRVNGFLHVNHSVKAGRYGILMCINGTGILNSWLKHNFSGLKYEEMNRLAASISPGSEGLIILPYGNGAERTLSNLNPGASVLGLDLVRHSRAHVLRAAQEGIVFALKYGMEIMEGMGMKPATTIRAGHANMFLSPVFSEAFACSTQASVELYSTDGAQGAARGAGFGAGVYKSMAEAFTGLKTISTIEPDSQLKGTYRQAYESWKGILDSILLKEK
jgi:xylulokinase